MNGQIFHKHQTKITRTTYLHLINLNNNGLLGTSHKIKIIILILANSNCGINRNIIKIFRFLLRQIKINRMNGSTFNGLKNQTTITTIIIKIIIVLIQIIFKTKSYSNNNFKFNKIKLTIKTLQCNNKYKKIPNNRLNLKKHFGMYNNSSNN